MWVPAFRIALIMRRAERKRSSGSVPWVRVVDASRMLTYQARWSRLVTSSAGPPCEAADRPCCINSLRLPILPRGWEPLSFVQRTVSALSDFPVGSAYRGSCGARHEGSNPTSLVGLRVVCSMRMTLDCPRPAHFLGRGFDRLQGWQHRRGGGLMSGIQSAALSRSRLSTRRGQALKKRASCRFDAHGSPAHRIHRMLR